MSKLRLLFVAALISSVLSGQTYDQLIDHTGDVKKPSDAFEGLSTWMLPPSPKSLPPGYNMLFGPNELIEREVISRINNSESEVLFSFYAINSRNFVSHLLRNYHKRKILMAGLLEGRPAIRDYKTIEFLLENSLPVLIPDESRIHNENFVIIDRSTVITGSYYPNSRRENSHVMIIEDPGMANEYYRRFYNLTEKSKNPLENE